MKRFLTLFLFAAMLMGATGAHAYFEDLDTGSSGNADSSARIGLYGAFYNITATGGELAIDMVGASDSFIPTGSHVPTATPYSRSLVAAGVLSATVSQTWSQVYFGGFAGTRNLGNSHIYMLANTPDGSLDAGEYALGSYSSTIGAMDATSTYWGGSASSPDWTFTGTSTNTNSFFKRLDSNSALILNGNIERINLGMWDTDENYVYEMYLYGFSSLSVPASLDSNQPYGKMTLSLVGGNLNVDYTPVPVPAAIWVLGSGLMGLLGFRKRFAA